MTLLTHPHAVALGCLAVVVLAGSAATAQKTDPAAILTVAADYIAKYEQEIVAVVAQEDYRQDVASVLRPTRQLRSDVLMIADGERGWIEFRDVYEVNGHQVRDRDDRIMRLFLKPTTDARQRAARIVEEGARFNLTPAGMTFERTLNIPLEALHFLRRANQSRSRFEIAGEERTELGQVVIVKFTEQAKPRLIHSPLDAPASGTFWIDPVSGAVVRSELKMSAPHVVATIGVTYGRQLEPAIWLPASMTEQYDLRDPTIAISGRATYSNFRRFRVDVSSDIKSEDSTDR